MKIFLDTSALVKLYHSENGTEALDQVFENYTISEVFLSDITKIEFTSAIWKKVRTKDLTDVEAIGIAAAFIADYNKYTFVETDDHLILNARNLVTKYGLKGLRTLDSIQLASILSVRLNLSFAITADELLKTLITLEGINVM